MSKTQTMTPERETWAILTTVHLMTQAERDEAGTRIARALKAEAALPDLLAAFRASAGEFARLAGMLQEGNPLFGKILRDAATAAYSAIAKAEGGAA